MPLKQHWPCSWNPPVPYHRMQVQQDVSTGTIKVLQHFEVLQRARRRISIPMCDQSTACNPPLMNSTLKRAGQNPENNSQEAIYHRTLARTSGLPEDAKSLRCCSWNRAKVLPKGHLGIKCHSWYNNKVVWLLQHSSADSESGWLGMHDAWPGDHHILGLTCIQFHSPKVTPLTGQKRCPATLLKKH